MARLIFAPDAILLIFLSLLAIFCLPLLVILLNPLFIFLLTPDELFLMTTSFFFLTPQVFDPLLFYIFFALASNLVLLLLPRPHPLGLSPLLRYTRLVLPLLLGTLRLLTALLFGLSRLLLSKLLIVVVLHAEPVKQRYRSSSGAPLESWGKGNPLVLSANT